MAQDTMRELLPCPFCGGEADRDNSEAGYEWIFCQSCGAQSGAHRMSRRHDIVADWNLRRPQDSGKNELVERLRTTASLLVESTIIADLLNEAATALSRHDGVRTEGQSHPLKGDGVWVPFNLNDKVRFRLTDLGREKIAEKDKRLNDFITERGGDPLGPRWTPDADGWVSSQLWCLMEDLGQYCGLGRPVPFETTIQLKLAAATPSTPHPTAGRPK